MRSTDDVAVFEGLSRGATLKSDGDSDGTDGSADAEGGDYYRSQAGVFPIRWTGE